MEMKTYFTDRVNHAPLFKKRPENQTAIVGQTITFEVEIHSDYQRWVEWIKGKCLNTSECHNMTKVMD